LIATITSRISARMIQAKRRARRRCGAGNADPGSVNQRKSAEEVDNHWKGVELEDINLDMFNRPTGI